MLRFYRRPDCIADRYAPSMKGYVAVLGIDERANSVHIVFLSIGMRRDMVGRALMVAYEIALQVKRNRSVSGCPVLIVLMMELLELLCNLAYFLLRILHPCFVSSALGCVQQMCTVGLQRRRRQKTLEMAIVHIESIRERDRCK